MARFVGADRGLKRLSLSRVAELELRPAVTVRVGEDVRVARDAAPGEPRGYALLVDGADRPIGWLDLARLPANGRLEADLAVPSSPLITARTSLRDALSMLLDAAVQVAIVVDDSGAVRGLVTADMIAERMRDTLGEGAPVPIG